MDRIVLDVFGDAELSDDHLLINTEALFLRNATSKAAMMIRGERLCEWATNFYNGREIPFGYAISPTRSLISRYPFLTQEQAIELRGRFHELPSSWEPEMILVSIWPDEFWNETIGKSHVARYLLWLADTAIPEYLTPILDAVADDWMRAAGLFSLGYGARSKASAKVFLSKWICASDVKISDNFGRFPLPLSEVWRSERSEYWKNEIIQSHGNFFFEFLQLESDHTEKVDVATESLKFFRLNQSSLTRELANAIKPYLKTSYRDELEELLPLPIPSKVPDEISDVMKWFSKEYLPYRWRAHRKDDGAAWEHSIRSAEEFAMWFLDHFHGLLAESKHFTHNRAANLTQYKESVNLVLLLDGLNEIDADSLTGQLLEKTSHLGVKMIEDGFSLSMLPTVTEFTKKHILSGKLVFEQDDNQGLGTDISDRKSPAEWLMDAMPGNILFWRLKEPDYTYHKEGPSADLDSRIESALYSVVLQVSKVIEECDPMTRLLIFITTDHGRVIGTSKKVIEPPEGFTPHGRAAWGVSDVDFGSKGYKVEGDIAFISQGTFLLEHPVAAVSIGQDAFKYSRFKEEVSPHGGVFPEEVIVPWLIFGRDVTRPRFTIELSGSAEANKNGQVTVQVTNPSDYVAELKQIRFDFGLTKENILSGDKIQPRRTNQYTYTIERWPSADQAQTGTGKIVAALPNGELIEQAFTTENLVSRSMYSRGNLLDGMDL